MIRCPWCGDPCYLALLYDRFNCDRCGNSGWAQFLEEKVKSKPQRKETPMFRNRAEIFGNVTGPAIVKTLPSGHVVANFTVATNMRWTDKVTNEKKEAVEFHRIVAWGKLAELSRKLEKGTRLSVEGRLQTRKWDQGGQPRQLTEVIASSMILNSPFHETEPAADEPTEAATQEAHFD
jgi:single-strand DNA-binding protein